MSDDKPEERGTDVTEGMRTPEGEQSFKLLLYVKEVRGKMYGSCPCTVRLGLGVVTDAYAVACADDKWVSTREDCVGWLVRHGLTESEADLLISLGEARAVRRDDVPPLSEQEEKGLYEEELGKLVDGVIEDVRSDHSPYTKDEAAWQLRAAVQRSNYALDETLALHVLKHSGKPWRLLDAALETMEDCAQEELGKRQEYKDLP